MSTEIPHAQPLSRIDDWDDFVEGRYREGKTEEEFRSLRRRRDAERGRVLPAEPRKPDRRLMYSGKRSEYFGLNKGLKTIWEAAEFLNTLVDDSDPDTDLTQIEHLLQTSEAMRRDNHPRWMVLTGFLHDLGKCLCLYGEPQWAVVGDTFPVGCAWSRRLSFRSTSPTIPTAGARVPDQVRHL